MILKCFVLVVQTLVVYDTVENLYYLAMKGMESRQVEEGEQDAVH